MIFLLFDIDVAFLSPYAMAVRVFCCGCGLQLVLLSFPTRRSSDLLRRLGPAGQVAEPVPAGPRDQARRARVGLRRRHRARARSRGPAGTRSEEHTSELQAPVQLVCRLLLDKKR